MSGPDRTVAEGSRPRVTFLLFAYNQEATVREACLAALAQEYEPLEVIFSDDGSRDRTWEVMQEVAAGYRGPHTLRLNRNPRNLGLIGHVNALMDIATGELVVAAAGDDVSLPERAGALVDAWLASGRAANSIHSSVTRIDWDGHPMGTWRPPLLDAAAGPDAVATSQSLLIGASHAWTRRVYEVFGPIGETDTFEDAVIAFRSLLLGPLAYVDRPLVRYRFAQGLSTQAPPSSDPATIRAEVIKSERRRAATLRQRAADCARAGRAPPAALVRGVALATARWKLAEGGARELWSVLRQRPGEALSLFSAWLSVTNAFRRARSRARRAAARSGL